MAAKFGWAKNVRGNEAPRVEALRIISLCPNGFHTFINDRVREFWSLNSVLGVCSSFPRRH
jgi:hypothetical protein